jgi:primary-amine oxidase
MTALQEPTTDVVHPLEPLTPGEIAAASSILKEARGLGPSARFVFVTLHEPPKEALRNWSTGDDPLPREARRALRARVAHHVRGGGVADGA